MKCERLPVLYKHNYARTKDFMIESMFPSESHKQKLIEFNENAIERAQSRSVTFDFKMFKGIVDKTE